METGKTNLIYYLVARNHPFTKTDKLMTLDTSDKTWLYSYFHTSSQQDSKEEVNINITFENHQIFDNF